MKLLKRIKCWFGFHSYDIEVDLSTQEAKIVRCCDNEDGAFIIEHVKVQVVHEDNRKN